MNAHSVGQAVNASPHHGRMALIEPLLTPRGVVAVWLVYASVLALLRLLFSRTLSYHDAISSAITHGFQFGYQKGQPPLWEWMLAAAQQLLGTGIESHLLVRYGVIAAVGIGLYRASLAASGDVRWSAAISFSVALSYQLGWRHFEGGTQALILAAACLFTLDAALRHVEKPNWKSAIYFGLAMGAGFLSKFSFELFMVALALALLIRPASRRGLLNVWTLLAAGVAIVMVLPYAIWFLQHSVDLGEVVQRRLVRTDESHVVRVLIGVKNLFVNTPAYLAPWFAVIAGLWWAGRSTRPTVEAARPAEGILRDTTLIALGITLAGIVAVGVTRFTVPYLHFILLPLFPYAAALLARSGPAGGPKLLAVTALVAMVVLTSMHIFALAAGSLSADRISGQHLPYAALARSIEERGLAKGTIVAFSVRDAGNLHAFLPAAEVLWHESAERTVTKQIVRQRSTCAAIWIDSEAQQTGADADDAKADDGTAEQHPSLAGRPQETIEAPLQAIWRRGKRNIRWILVRLDPADSICREG